MTRVFSIFLLLFFLIGTGDSIAQTTGNEKQKKTSKKKPVKENEERIEEITEDVVISTRTVDTAGRSSYQRPTPVKTFDTTLAPNDALTIELHKLIAEMGVVDFAIETARDMVAKNSTNNVSAELKEFYTRFSKSLGSAEVTGFYHNLFTKLYRKYYTLEEVVELRKFYQSALGKKTIRIMSPIMQESMTEGGKFGEYWAEKIFFEMNNGK